MRGGIVLFGFVILLISVALLLLNGSMYSLIGIGLGAIIFLWGLFKKKKQYYMGQSFGNQTMMMGGNPAQTQVMQRI